MNSLSLITIFFFFFALSAKFQLGLSRSAENVVDRSGKQVLAGVQYYVLPALSAASGRGGLTFRKIGNSTCSTSVLHENLQGSLGKLVRFNITGGLIFTGSVLDIEFVEKPDCIKSSKWRVFNENDDKTTAFVGVGNAEEYPGNKIKNGLFKIEKLNSNYKFMFCDSGPYNCSDIGFYNDPKIVDAQPLKLFQSKPLEITFLKA